MLVSLVWTILSIGYTVAAFIAAVFILRRPRQPRAMLAWIMTVLLLPWVGVLLFLIAGEPRRGLHRRLRKRRRRKLERHGGSVRKPEINLAAMFSEQEIGLTRLMHFANRLGAFPPTRNNRVEIYHQAEKTFLDLQMAIAAAESHIHLEYYIYQPDETGAVIRDRLIEKARQGVEVRVLLDALGCWRLPKKFLRPLQEAGGKVAYAMPVIPWRGRWRANYRNHRKIAVFDGRTGFTGSQNIGDEYRGRRTKIGLWRDTHLKIVGPAVAHLQEVFAEDWHYTTQEALFGDPYYPPATTLEGHAVQIVPSGPDQRTNILHQMLFMAVSAAHAEISIITPYFIPDDAMLLALQSAAYRGVAVRLIIPSCTDHRLSLWAGRSFYEELIRAGVEIREHDTIMLHSKVVIVDQNWAMVGSANIDERSFRLNFELTTLLYGPELTEQLYRDFEALRKQSRLATARAAADLPFGESLVLGLARLASPLL